MATLSTTVALPNTVKITHLLNQDNLSLRRDRFMDAMITSNYADVVRKRRAKMDKTQIITDAYDLDDALLTLGGDEDEIDDNLTLDEKWEYISHHLQIWLLEEETTTNRALRAAYLREERPQALFKDQYNSQDRANLPQLPQICPSCGTVVKELIQYFRHGGNKCCPNLDCGYPILAAPLPYQGSIKFYLFHYSIGEFALHDTGLFSVYDNSPSIPLSQSLAQTKINPKETPSYVRIQGGGKVRPWLAPTVNGVRVDKSWTMTFECSVSGFKIEISNEDVVKIIEDGAVDRRGRRIAEL